MNVRSLVITGVVLLATATLAGCGSIAPSATQPTPARIVPITATPGTPGADVTAEVSGTLTFVDSPRRIINVTTHSGAVLILSVAINARVTVHGADATLDSLADKI